MTKTINISDEAYEWLLGASAKEQLKETKKTSIADIVDTLIKKESL